MKELTEGKHYIKSFEKQGEPKFKVGDWIVYKDTVWKVCNIFLLNYYELLKINNEVSTRRIEDVDKNARLWTIQDAKDGDVLATLDHILIFEKLLPKDGGVSYCHYDFGCSTPQFDFNKDDNWYFGKEAKVYPATKEQRDLLFQKMKEADYEWDAEKKELKKIEQNLAEQNVDNRKLCNIVIEELSKYSGNEVCKAPWALDSTGVQYPLYFAELGAKWQKEQKPTWSEEDECRMNNLCHFLEEYGNQYYGHLTLQGTISWLKSLRPQNNITDEKLAQAKKDAYNDALDKIEYHSGEPTFDDGWSAAIWYLKKRNTMPQKQWKPSEKQKAAICYAAGYVFNKHPEITKTLKDMLNELEFV